MTRMWFRRCCDRHDALDMPGSIPSLGILDCGFVAVLGRDGEPAVRNYCCEGCPKKKKDRKWEARKLEPWPEFAGGGQQVHPQAIVPRVQARPPKPPPPAGPSGVSRPGPSRTELALSPEIEAFLREHVHPHLMERPPRTGPWRFPPEDGAR